MPYSFAQIEQEKTGTIQFSLAFLLLFYFISALTIVYFCKAYFVFSTESVPYGMPVLWPQLDWPTIAWTLGGSILVGIVHWHFSQDALIDKVLQMMSARLADESVQEERIFRNVVEEASVATGGKYRIEPYILPTTAMNAFALQDFQGRCVVGITEGLLRRLNREQLEAVVGHEAGHIASGDCVETTTTSALFKTFDNICDITLRLLLSSGRVGMIGAGYAARGSRRSYDGRLAIFFLMLFVLSSALRLIGVLGAMFISRQREYRADALSAKLTRNPMALAEALHIINSRWKGAGIPGEKMDAIFISNPRYNALEQSNNFLADLFTTHPPAQKRIAILLSMAHANAKDLDQALARAKARFDAFYTKPEQVQCSQSILCNSQNAKKNSCPRCQVLLQEEAYEGVKIWQCKVCSGVLVKELDVLKIVHTYEKAFDDRIARMGQLIRQQVKPMKQNPFDGIYDEKSVVCPACLDMKARMHRRFVSPQMPVEVDKCRVCGRVWFDKDELEVLQYLYESDKSSVDSSFKGNHH